MEYTDEFGCWWNRPTLAEQAAIDGVVGSRHNHMRELRIQSGGRPVRVFYAFDPRRFAILLIGGEKTGDNRFYVRLIPLADDLYDEHLEELRREKLIE